LPAGKTGSEGLDRSGYRSATRLLGGEQTRLGDERTRRIHDCRVATWSCLRARRGRTSNCEIEMAATLVGSRYM
jgi:hypothetical protein